MGGYLQARREPRFRRKHNCLNGTGGTGLYLLLVVAINRCSRGTVYLLPAGPRAHEHRGALCRLLLT